MTKTETSAKDLCVFLSQYCAALLGSGATCIRLSKNAERIAAAYGRKAEITIMPRHIYLSVLNHENGEAVTTIESVPTAPVSFNVNTRLSLLSWQIHDNGLSLEEARKCFREILDSDSQSRWSVLPLVSLANAAFCFLFGGDRTAMAIVLVATLAGYYLKQELLGRHVDTRITFVLCSFFSAVIAASDMLFNLGTTPQITLGTSVLYLVPGIPFLNSFSDLLYRHYICAFSRFVDAVILTSCLSTGLCAGMFLMQVGMF